MAGRFIDAMLRALQQLRAEGVALPRPPSALTLTAEQYDCAAMELAILGGGTCRDDFGNDATEWHPCPLAIEMRGVRFRRGGQDA